MARQRADCVLVYSVSMTDEKILICNPDHPLWFHTPTSITSIADCGHQVKISASGVGLLLTTPGLKTVCMHCLPPKGEHAEYHLEPETAAEFKRETGEDITPEFMERMAEWANRFRK